MTRSDACSTLVFDVETKYLAQEVGGWDHIRDMGLSVAVIYSVDDQCFSVYEESQVQALIRDLLAARKVIGFNLIRFDYEVLRPYYSFPLRDAVPTLDMMLPLYQTLGFRPKLEDLAAATLGVGKLGDGVEAVRWFREGRMEQLIAYCKQDVQVTYDLYEFGKQNGYVLLRDRSRGSRRIPVSW